MGFWVTVWATIYTINTIMHWSQIFLRVLTVIHWRHLLKYQLRNNEWKITIFALLYLRHMLQFSCFTHAITIYCIKKSTFKNVKFANDIAIIFVLNEIYFPTIFWSQYQLATCFFSIGLAYARKNSKCVTPSQKEEIVMEPLEGSE